MVKMEILELKKYKNQMKLSLDTIKSLDIRDHVKINKFKYVATESK